MGNDTKVIIGIGVLAVAILAGIVVFGSSTIPTTTPAKQVEKAELVRPESHAVGPTDAKVTVVEFADFQCPACAATHPVMKQLMGEYADRVRFVHRNFPLSSIHPNAELAARAAESAGLQGKFWEMYDKLFETQAQWSTQVNPEGTFTGYAKDLGLDTAKFKDDLGSEKVTEIIALDKGDSQALGLTSTPTIYINDQQFAGDRSYEGLKSAIEAGLTQ